MALLIVERDRVRHAQGHIFDFGPNIHAQGLRSSLACRAPDELRSGAGLGPGAVDVPGGFLPGLEPRETRLVEIRARRGRRLTTENSLRRNNPASTFGLPETCTGASPSPRSHTCPDHRCIGRYRSRHYNRLCHHVSRGSAGSQPVLLALVQEARQMSLLQM